MNYSFCGIQRGTLEELKSRMWLQSLRLPTPVISRKTACIKSYTRQWVVGVLLLLDREMTFFIN